MYLLGLHLLDWLVILLYIGALVWIGRRVSSSVQKQSDFYLAGRKLGPVLQFFLNFGNMTDASAAASVTTMVYRQGVGGVWLNLQTLFMTPYYWFLFAWLRRLRLTTVADIFRDRFGSNFLPVVYAVVIIFMNLMALGASYLIIYKMVDVLAVKPEASYSQKERESVDRYQHFAQMRKDYRADLLTEPQKKEYETLALAYERGEIKPYVSYIKRLPFYIGFSVIVGLYIIMGGMRATALSDALQGILIIIFSLMIIPFGLAEIGGTTEFAKRLPENILDLFGSGGSSDFAWYSVLAILLVGLITIHAVPSQMGIASSAKTESAAAIGALSGGFMKRWMIIAWCFCGLIAIALFGQDGLSDPDGVWGALARKLLGPGMIGLFLVGVLAGEMSSISAQSLSLSALFVRNIYLVAFPKRREEEGLFIGRILIALSLIIGILAAYLIGDIYTFIKLGLTFNVTFGAVVFVIFKWRKVTKTAAITTVLLAQFLLVVLPLTIPLIPGLNNYPALLQTTHEKRVVSLVASKGVGEDAGQPIEKREVIAPKPIYFERVVSTNPNDPAAPLRGSVRFNAELYALSLLGMDMRNLQPAQLLALQCLIASLLPFLIIFATSLLTKDHDPERTQRFYAKMRTRVSGNPEEDASNVKYNQEHPEESEKLKLLPGSSWEFLRWRKIDYIAFGICCAIAGATLGLFFLLLRLPEILA